MRLEFIDNVEENEVLGRNIYTDEGVVLLKEGVELNSYFIDRLKKLGISYVYIKDERFEDIIQMDEKIVELKSSAIKCVSKVMKNGFCEDKNQVKKIVNTLEDLISYVMDNGKINNYLVDIRAHDDYTYIHCVETGVMATFLGISLCLKRDEIKELGVGAILHDIGKIKISNDIINKKGRLTAEEFDEMKKHPMYGKEILEKNYIISDNAIRGVLEHHEKFDGTGYPRGLKGNGISKFGKITCICDTYTAVSSNRSYREKFKPNEAYELILAGSGSMFDDKIVEKFKGTFFVYPLGTRVKLSNNIEGYVIKQNIGFPDRPIIRVIDVKRITSKLFYEIDLLKYIDLTIVDVP